MRIILTDGSVLECNTIEIYGSKLYVDEYRIVEMYDVNRIEGQAEILKSVLTLIAMYAIMYMQVKSDTQQEV